MRGARYAADHYDIEDEYEDVDELLPAEFFERRDGVRVGNVLETSTGCARIGQDGGTAC